jgi:hypothetical protein
MAGGGGVAPKRNVFLGKTFADLTIKSLKTFTQPQIKTTTHPWPIVYKRIPFS